MVRLGVVGVCLQGMALSLARKDGKEVLALV